MVPFVMLWTVGQQLEYWFKDLALSFPLMQEEMFSHFPDLQPWFSLSWMRAITNSSFQAKPGYSQAVKSHMEETASRREPCMVSHQACTVLPWLSPSFYSVMLNTSRSASARPWWYQKPWERCRCLLVFAWVDLGSVASTMLPAPASAAKSVGKTDSKPVWI